MERTSFDIDNANQLGSRDLPEIDFWLNADADRCVVVKRNSKRTVYAISRELGGKPTVFLKHDHPQGPRDRGKQIIRPKVQYEFLHTQKLLELGLPIVKPLFAAWNLVEGVFISEALRETRDAIKVWEDIGQDANRRKLFLAGLKTMIDALVNHRVFHPDFHLGNLLCRETPRSIDFFLVDCFSVQPSATLSRRKRNVMLLIIFQLQNRLSEADVLGFLHDLSCTDANETSDELLDHLHCLSCNSFYRKWPKRKRKLMRSSGFSAHHTEDDGDWRINRASILELNKEIIAEHRRIRDAEDDAMLKVSKKRCVTAPVVDGVTYIVKEFYKPGPWGSRAADARCWTNNWGLSFCGLPIPPVQAWYRDSDGHGYVVSAFVSGSNAYDAMMDCLDDDDAFNAIAEQVYGIVRKLYHSRIMHGDLKLNNMLLDGEKLWLIDNDSVQFNVKISPKHWEKNLKHLVRRGESPAFVKLKTFIDQQPRPF